MHWSFYTSKNFQVTKNSTYQSYAYDYENRIVSAARQATGNPDADTVTFKYDPFGRRIEKSVSTYENGIPTTYKYTYIYDNEDIILEVLDRTQNGTTTTTTTAYTHGPGIDEPLSLARDGQTYYYHADGLGSVTSMTDSTQAAVNRYAYDSFGAIDKYETVRNAYAYTGREYDSETGLYYYRARYYDPEAGRFVSKDPIGFAGGDVTLYGYVGNSPTNWLDPLGLTQVYIEVTRVFSGRNNIIGNLSINNGTTLSPAPLGHTLELPWLGNQKEISHIPAGNYAAEIYNSQTFGRVIRLKNVPGRSDILIHPGNSANDTKGCILPGKDHNQEAVQNSKKALRELLQYIDSVSFGDSLRGESTSIEVIIK